MRVSFVKSVIKEYGLKWLFHRLLYNLKLKVMRIAPLTERLYEKKPQYPKRVNIFSIDTDKLKSFIKEKLSEEDKKCLIDIADKACRGIIRGFSSIDLDYSNLYGGNSTDDSNSTDGGNSIDWQLNPLTGKRCNEKAKWYNIPDFEKTRGDIKVIWEASRFSHFLTLTRAYLLTEDRKYYEAFSSQLKDWLENNYYSYGANFKCGQECSIRMVNALLAYTVFKECGVITDADASNVRDLVDRCYRKVLANFSYAYKCIKNNHTISELMGMIVGAWCCRDQKRLDEAYNLLDEVIDEQFTSDGGYRQFSFNYQRLALQDLECVLSVEKKTGKSLSEHSKEKIKNASLLMYQCQDETGDMPNYGSNDGALIFPVTNCGYRDFRSVINAVYDLITGKQIYEGTDKQQEELVWFSGGKKTFGEYEAVERVSSQFIDAGIFTIRGSNSWAMIISNDYHSRPAHMDQLHFDLWINGINVLCDAGTYSYASEEERRLTKNESHNTAVVDGITQMNTKGPFMVYAWTKREIIRASDTAFEGKTVSRNGYTHFRSIKLTKARLYEITDRVDGVKKDYSVVFHTLCDVQKDGSAYILKIGNKALCRVRSNGEIMLQQSQRSLYYLQKECTFCLTMKCCVGTEIQTAIETLCLS